MKKLYTPLLVLILTAFSMQGQYNARTSQLGISIGTSSFLGDLGGARTIGRASLYDLDILSTRPSAGVFFKQTMGARFAFRVNAYYGRVWGNDALANAKTPAAGAGWHRFYRNLSFRSYIIEASVVGEMNLIPFEPGNMSRNWAPYLFAGVGAFRFDPKANVGGTWVRLQPLGTEGQGLIQYPTKEEILFDSNGVSNGCRYKNKSKHTLYSWVRSWPQIYNN